jgi:hypothetical protein
MQRLRVLTHGADSAIVESIAHLMLTILGVRFFVGGRSESVARCFEPILTCFIGLVIFRVPVLRIWSASRFWLTVRRQGRAKFEADMPPGHRWFGDFAEHFTREASGQSLCPVLLGCVYQRSTPAYLRSVPCVRPCSTRTVGL